MPKFILLFVPASLIAAPSVAQTPVPSPLVTALQACQALTDGNARLACYDRTGPALTDAATKGEIALVERSQVRKVRRSMFGFNVPKFPFFDDRDGKDGDDPKEIESKVRSASSIGNGRYRVVIEDGGAVWQTSEASTTPRDPARGDKVTIKSGSLGSYYLRIGSQRWVKARRVR